MGGVGPIGLGLTMLWLSVIVLLPLAALTVKALDGGLGGIWDAISAPSAQAALTLTVAISLIVAAVNVVVGTLIAWVLVRDEFRGKALVNAVIDLPFALPTIVASIVLLSLYGPQSPIDVHLYATRPALVVALLFVTLPFVVRSVQPVLMEVDREAEEAAASLGASRLVTFRRIILPAIVPALLSGAGLAFARAVGEFGSVVLIGGGIPARDRGGLAVHRQADRGGPARVGSRGLGHAAPHRLRRAGCPPGAGRAHPEARGRVSMATGLAPRLTLRFIALGYLVALVMVPLGMIFYRTFENGFVAFWEQVTTPAGDLGDQPVADHRGHRRPVERDLRRGHGAGPGPRQLPRAGAWCETVVDLPFAVSPVVVGVSLILLWGVDGWLGGLADHGIRIIFSLPGMVIATIFVTLPFVVREVEPVLHEIGDEQEQAAATLGRVLAPDVLAHHAPVDPLGPALRRGAHRGPRHSASSVRSSWWPAVCPASRRPLRFSYTRAISMTTTPSAPTPRPRC